jgi:hypothetical protein
VQESEMPRIHYETAAEELSQATPSEDAGMRQERGRRPCKEKVIRGVLVRSRNPTSNSEPRRKVHGCVRNTKKQGGGAILGIAQNVTENTRKESISSPHPKKKLHCIASL